MTEHENTHPEVDGGDGAPRLHRFEDGQWRSGGGDGEVLPDSGCYALFAAYTLASPLPALEDTRHRLISESTFFIDIARATTRGWYDVSSFRADAELLVCWYDEDPARLQEANHRLRSSALGRYLRSAWSAVASVPSSSALEDSSREWCTVYPVSCDNDRYRLAHAELSRQPSHDARSAVPGDLGPRAAVLSGVGLGRGQWLLVLEAQTLPELEAAVRRDRAVQAHLDGEVETPVFVGARVTPREWGERQPRA